MFSSQSNIPPEWGHLIRYNAWLHKAGLWNGPAYSWPCKQEAPSLFEDHPEPPSIIGRDVKRPTFWSHREAIRNGDGHIVCTEYAVGIMGKHACYYVPYPFLRRQYNHLTRWLDARRGALSLHRLVLKYYGWKLGRRLKQLQKERRQGRKTNSHFLREEKHR